MTKKFTGFVLFIVFSTISINAYALFDDVEPAARGELPLKKLNYIDEGEKNASFEAFRQEFLKRIEKRDVRYLMGILDPNFKFTMGNAAEFKRFYSLDREGDKSIVWRELKRAMLLGGVFTEEGFCAPYVTCAWPEGLEPAGMAAIISSETKLHKSPSESSPILATLDHDIVKTTYDSKALRAGWKSVQTLNGTKGYVKSNEAILGNDYRAFFREKNGKWYLTVYISG